MRCVAIVPFLNEEALLPTFLESVDAQTVRPALLVLVDDGSTDRSPELAEAFAASRPWARLLRRPARPASRDRLSRAPELAAFVWAREQVDDGFDVVVKLDADLRLGPRHFETALGALAREPRLGISGCYLTTESTDGDPALERHEPEHVRGASRFYRAECLREISPIPQILGWDGADEVRARARGWQTRSLELPGEPTLHLRPTGSHDGRLRAYVRWGTCAYAVGAYPAAAIGGGLLRLRNRPYVLGGLAYVFGWATGGLRKVPRAPTDVRAATRAEHVARLRRGLAAVTPR
jgi:poly-beta-1,6-N-acetyl-D-glucosamine synthase